jgi:hypothetical protein
MGLPTEPVTLSIEQLDDLNRKLSNMCHDIRNSLSLVAAASELIRQKPELTERMMSRVVDQPAKISGVMDHFRAEFEKALGITRP